MADSTIHGLTDGVTANATDEIPVARSPFAAGDDRRITPAYIKDYMLALANTWANTQTFANVVLGSTSTLAWSTDLFHARDAAGISAQRNLANSQAHRIYAETDAGLANYARTLIGYVDTSDGIGLAFRVNEQAAGTGTRYQMVIEPFTTVYMKGNLEFFADSTRNIGGAGSNRPQDLFLGRSFAIEATVTAGGTTGAQTINKAAGTVNFAATATALTVTNSLVTANSLIFCELRTNDATARIANVVPGSGTFTINLTAAATAETSCGFFVVQPD